MKPFRKNTDNVIGIRVQQVKGKCYLSKERKLK